MNNEQEIEKLYEGVEQMTSQQAIAFGQSRVWEEWTPEQICRLVLFQKCLPVPFSAFHEAIETCLGRPVFTHEFGMNYVGIVKEFLGENPKPTLDEIFELIPADKRILILKP